MNLIIKLIIKNILIILIFIFIELILLIKFIIKIIINKIILEIWINKKIIKNNFILFIIIIIRDKIKIINNIDKIIKLDKLII